MLWVRLTSKRWLPPESQSHQKNRADTHIEACTISVTCAFSGLSRHSVAGRLINAEKNTNELATIDVAISVKH